MAVVEFQAFKDNSNNFIIKELAIVSDSLICQLIFSSPYEFHNLNEKMRRTARWLTRHHHYINWDDGKVQYNKELIRTLCSPFDVIYSKGLEKVKFLKQFHSNVQEYPGGTSPKINGIHCILPRHGGDFSRCALHSAYERYKGLG